MPRYIDAENIPTKFINFGMPTVICGIEVPDIDSAPTLSPDDVRGVGKWEEKEYFDLENTTIEQMQSARCSVCGKYHTTPFSYYFTDYAYCPNCGARMEVPDDA